MKKEVSKAKKRAEKSDRIPLGKDKFPGTLTKFAIFCQNRFHASPNFATQPFECLVGLFEHRNILSHMTLRWAYTEKRPTGTNEADVRFCHYLECAREAAYRWYEAVKWYFNQHGGKEREDGGYVGILSSYQHTFRRLIGKPIKPRRGHGTHTLAISELEEIRDIGTHEGRRALVYANKALCFSVNFTRRGIEGQSITLEVQPDTALKPADGNLDPIEPIEAPDLKTGIELLVPQLREAYNPPPEEWWAKLAG